MRCGPGQQKRGTTTKDEMFRSKSDYNKNGGTSTRLQECGVLLQKGSERRARGFSSNGKKAVYKKAYTITYGKACSGR